MSRGQLFSVVLPKSGLRTRIDVDAILGAIGVGLAAPAQPRPPPASHAASWAPGAQSVAIGGSLTADDVQALDGMIDDAIYQRRGPAGELLPAVPLPDAAAPALFASFTGALAGAEDGSGRFAVHIASALGGRSEALHEKSASPTTSSLA